MTHIAELRSVSKTFDGITVLDNVNLQIEEGEILGLLGPNGSGKSTLLKILAFLENVSGGEIHFKGAKVTEKKIEQLRMQATMVFQKTVLFSTTVYNNVAYGLRIRRIPKKKVFEEVTEALRLVRLDGFEQRDAKKLSGGEQQRVALARALVVNSKLLLLDEPTANLDPKNASIIEEVITAVNREFKATVVMATHNMFQAKAFPQRIALIANGRIGEVGTPSEIFGKLSKTLASFAALENTFAGTAEVTENGTTLIDIGNGVQLESTGQVNGSVSIFIGAEDIIVSKDRFTSSARNTFKGKIVEILDAGHIVKLGVDIGKVFTIQITKRSFNEMALNLDAEVFLAFKASSVQIV